MNEIKAIIEGLLFVSGSDGLTLDELKKIIEKDESDIKEAIKLLYKDYESNERGIQLEFLGDHFKLTTKPIHKNYYKKLVNDSDTSTLSQASIETLAIIAYNAPLTRIDIDNIRGVNSSYAIRKLLLKGLIEEVGRADKPGKPRLYNITDNFLDYFGLGSTEDLPKIETEDNENIKETTTDLFKSKYIEKEDNES